MSCERFEASLDDYLDGRLSDVERRAAEGHLADCERCRALLATLCVSLGALGPEALVPVEGLPPDLAGPIVARTSGPACGRAQALLCDLADGALAPAEARLVTLHLENCPRCAALYRTLAWLGGELPQMAAIEPDPALVGAIVAATTGQRVRRTAWRAAARDWLQRIVARPRFAWEVAYVATLAVVLLFGTSLSPFRDVPPRALAIIQIDPRLASGEAAQDLRELHGGIGAAGGKVWDATGGRVADYTRGAGARVADRHPGMRGAWSGMNQHGGELRQSLSGRNFASAGLAFEAWRHDLLAFLASWRAVRTDTPASTGVPAAR